MREVKSQAILLNGIRINGEVFCDKSYYKRSQKLNNIA